MILLQIYPESENISDFTLLVVTGAVFILVTLTLIGVATYFYFEGKWAERVVLFFIQNPNVYVAQLYRNTSDGTQTDLVDAKHPAKIILEKTDLTGKIIGQDIIDTDKSNTRKKLETITEEDTPESIEHELSMLGNTRQRGAPYNNLIND